MVLSKTNKPRTYSEYKWTVYTWYVLHTMGLYAEEELKTTRAKEAKHPPKKLTLAQKKLSPPHPAKKYIKFLTVLSKELPCPDCTEHYRTYLKTHRLSKKTNFHGWTVGLHNNVNERLGKRTYTPLQASRFYLLEDKLEIDWWYYYFMIKTFANIAYTNGTIPQFCRTLDLFRRVVPSNSLRRRLPQSKDFQDRRIFIRRYLIALKKKMDAVEPRLKQLRFTKGR